MREDSAQVKRKHCFVVNYYGNVVLSNNKARMWKMVRKL